MTKAFPSQPVLPPYGTPGSVAAALDAAVAEMEAQPVVVAAKVDHAEQERIAQSRFAIHLDNNC